MQRKKETGGMEGKERVKKKKKKVAHPLILLLYQNKVPTASRISNNSRRTTGMTIDAVPAHAHAHTHT